MRSRTSAKRDTAGRRRTGRRAGATSTEEASKHDGLAGMLLEAANRVANGSVLDGCYLAFSLAAPYLPDVTGFGVVRWNMQRAMMREGAAGGHKLPLSGPPVYHAAAGHTLPMGPGKPSSDIERRLRNVEGCVAEDEERINRLEGPLVEAENERDRVRNSYALGVVDRILADEPKYGLDYHNLAQLLVDIVGDDVEWVTGVGCFEHWKPAQIRGAFLALLAAAPTELDDNITGSAANSIEHHKNAVAEGGEGCFRSPPDDEDDEGTSP